ncbi:YlxR family protein [[Mycobacterium] nativiensis]|uniref:YlxR family protein n=1 Tax=[Mycobacterium] nativiensis TaxID=2855503 RepID=A0ABU5XXT8_9MYCO|nr:YlxR family protein [Mycolicibacter sp. MYC340]MEB3032743.1 YlxR family protein [Mycolicibacter sp. MYC340]
MSTTNGNGAVVVDRAGNQPGRGAWLHPAPECLQAAIRRRAFSRALRISGSPDVSGVEEYFDRLEIGSPPRETEQVAKNMSTP